MASLLVYIELDSLDVSRRDSGEHWQIGRNDLRNPSGEIMVELDRLDDDATLFLCTVDGDSPVLVGWADDFSFDDNDRFTAATIHLSEHDLVELLPRLGCTTDLATFARPPRVLPPGDVELLRYVLSLADDRVRPPPAPEPIIADTPELVALRDAVYADPSSDEPRAIYADALQARGDPRGELIALQLARAAAGIALPTRRERVLERRLADLMPGPLASWLEGYELARGFVARCSTRSGMPDGVARHPIWATVDELHTTDRNLLGNPHLHARRLGVAGRELLFLSRSPDPLPYEMIGGRVWIGRGASRRQTGVEYTSDWSAFAASTAFPRLRTLSLHHSCPAVRMPVHRMLANPVGRALTHLDVYFRGDQRPPAELVSSIRTSSLDRLTIRLDIIGVYEPRVILGFLRDRLVLEVADALDHDETMQVIRFIAPLVVNYTAIELNDYTSADGLGRNVELQVELHPLVVTLTCRPTETLAP